MENNNNQSTTSRSSCRAPLPVDSRYRTCQAFRERVAASRRRHRAEDQQEEADIATRPRGRPRTIESSDAESRPRGRPRSDDANSMPAAYISQLSRLRPLGLGCMDKECPNCHALHWTGERQQNSSQSNPIWESCYTIGRQFKDNLRQYNAAFAFTSLGCDIVSAEERNANSNNRRGGLNAFQIHGALCHRQGPLFLVEGNASLYAQLYIYDPSYAAQRRSERNENLKNGNIESLSIMLAQCNPFARIYCHAYKILSNHESFSINSEKRSSNNGSTESGSPYIIISSSMRIRLIEGDDRRAQDLPTMEKVVAVIQIEYNDRGFCNIVLTLISSSRNDSLR
ncbi:unnamed protein product [Rhizopus microsporus]